MHRFSQKDYFEAINNIFSEKKHFIFKNLALKKNGNGKNPLMSAAVCNSNHSLCHMMYKIAVQLTSSEKEELLHHKNNFGETLLGLVLRQQGTLIVPQTILLELEKSYHGHEKDVTKCFRATLQSSLEVHKSLKNIEKTYEKGIL